MADQDLDLTSHIFVSQRLKQHYVDWGNAGAPPLILLHGGRDHCRNWDWVAKALRRDFHVIAPDLRGHGDSEWSPDGNYSIAAHVYDLAQLIHQQKLAPVRIIAHSFGAAIALRYTGIYPEAVAGLIAIEGLFRPSARAAQRNRPSVDQRMRNWIDDLRRLSGRQPRRYASIEEALARMQQENSHLSPEQARHLTVHGVSQSEDGSYSWKFDNYVRSISPVDLTEDEYAYLLGRIDCPTLLVHGKESWVTDPAESGMLDHFRNARVARFENAGHWVHHDQLDRFLDEARRFLG
jgi:pimeloyl-ACP methyl ester carboxylesterase